MSVAVQIIGKKWEEEEVLRMMKVIDEALQSERGFKDQNQPQIFEVDSYYN